MAARSQLEGRILAILDTRRNRRNKTSKVQIALGALALATLVPLSSLAWAQLDTSPAAEESVTLEAASDSARFERRLTELRINRDDVDRLIAGLGDRDALTRGACAQALGSSGDPRAIAPLIRATSDVDAVARQWAVRVLGNCGDPRAIDLLRPMLDDQDAEVREWAGRALDDLGR